MKIIFDSITEILYIIPVLLISLTFHEFMHAYTSDRLGDPTPKSLNRLSLNPLRHLDPVGTLMMIFARVGWAKPVPINPAYYRNRKKGIFLVSIAGPAANLILSFLFYTPFYIIFYNINNSAEYSELMFILMTFCYMMYFININLAIFNLLPIPPLDGSKILSLVLREEKYIKFLRYERYMGLVFILIIWVFPSQFGAVLAAIRNPVMELIGIISEPLIKVILGI